MGTLLYWQVGDVRSPAGENWKHRARSSSCLKQQLETWLVSTGYPPLSLLTATLWEAYTP